MLGISAIHTQMQACHGLSLADGLADVRSFGSLKCASDHPEELHADFRCKDVALLGASARLPDCLRERMPAVDDFFLAFRGALLR
jgi:hypothetical protein